MANLGSRKMTTWFCLKTTLAVTKTPMVTPFLCMVCLRGLAGVYCVAVSVPWLNHAPLCLAVEVLMHPQSSTPAPAVRERVLALLKDQASFAEGG